MVEMKKNNHISVCDVDDDDVVSEQF
ncbi:hypothetical protein PPL_07988 [Heterostelium album PN500]|uniref:Uncharacterized protein n=1 Tax=Heterostelium pallidum (strain ATCC 26659 / Pp 5 / PN500) TaxID=670386 RepID=D3BHI6_HETP5|nr:hypothetical protein PPL_07988 [Heterostelium album PN500]